MCVCVRQTLAELTCVQSSREPGLCRHTRAMDCRPARRESGVIYIYISNTARTRKFKTAPLYIYIYIPAPPQGPFDFRRFWLSALERVTRTFALSAQSINLSPLCFTDGIIVSPEYTRALLHRRCCCCCECWMQNAGNLFAHDFYRVYT